MFRGTPVATCRPHIKEKNSSQIKLLTSNSIEVGSGKVNNLINKVQKSD